MPGDLVNQAHCPNCGRYTKTLPCCEPKPAKEYKGVNSVNFFRSKQQRRARYCFIRSLGINRSLARRLAGWSDAHFQVFLENNLVKLEVKK